MSEKSSAKTPYTLSALISCLVVALINVYDPAYKASLLQGSPIIGSAIGYGLMYLLACAGVVSLEKRQLISRLQKEKKYLERELKELKSQDNCNLQYAKELEQKIHSCRMAIAKSYEMDDSAAKKDGSPTII